MSILEVSNLKFNYGDKDLFNNASLRLFKEDHMGLVGTNGCGKTTLMNLIAKNLIPDQGKIEWLPNIHLGYLDQHMKVDKHVSIHDYLYKVFDDLFEKEKEMQALFESLATAKEYEYDRIMERALQIQDYLEEKNFYGLKSRIGNVIFGLGIHEDRMNDELAKLSGGQREKVILGKLLLEEPDVLLLDEPTNFLDTMHIEWLTKYLISYPNAFIVISHDKEFLNNVCNVIVSLENRVLTRYKGNYHFYLQEREIRNATYEKTYNNQQKLIKKTEEFIAKNIVRASTTKQAQSRRKMLDKLDVLEKPSQEKKVSFNFECSGESAYFPLIVDELEIGYNKALLKPLSFKIKKGEKVVITGKNGIGKTTLLKTILNQIPSLGGSFKFAENVKYSYFEQEVDFTPSITPFQYIKDDYPEWDNKKIRSVLGRVGIGSDLVMKPMKELSGGEQTKVRLCLMNLKRVNFLIFDEPTNHLDYVAKKALFDAIMEFKGTVLLVSHEKDFYKLFSNVEINL